MCTQTWGNRRRGISKVCYLHRGGAGWQEAVGIQKSMILKYDIKVYEPEIRARIYIYIYINVYVYICICTYISKPTLRT